MRTQSHRFIEKFLLTHTATKVLEVGSLDVNGNIRERFTGMEYVGTDMRSGNNVDIVINGHDLSNLEGKFDLVVCFDTLEHDDKFWLTVEQMRKILLPGGYLIIGVPGRNCPLHEHPGDYWRFMKSGVETFFEGFEDVYIDEQKDDPNHVYEDEIYGWGKKP